MGAWGTGIFQNDTSCDSRAEFIGYLEEGKSVIEATNDFLSAIEGTDLNDLAELSLIYIGLAATQLEKKCLQEHVRKKTIKLIEDGADLDLWEEAEGTDYEERKKILNNFKRDLFNYINA
jgi:hypothetical protein